MVQPSTFTEIDSHPSTRSSCITASTPKTCIRSLKRHNSNSDMQAYKKSHRNNLLVNRRKECEEQCHFNKNNENNYALDINSYENNEEQNEANEAHEQDQQNQLNSGRVAPESRRNKEIIGGYATKYPDYTFLPDHLSGFSSKPTYSVEIKPKQGFVCEADYRHFKKCPYCLKQYYKLKEGSIRQPSKYCPFDLFSGSADRMDRALTSLLLSPQNNLRIFKNGCSIYGEANQGTEVLQSILDGWFFGAGLEAFLLLVRTALSRDFDRVNNAAVAKRLSGRKLERTRVDAPPRLEPELVRCVQEVIQAAGVEECEPPPPPPPSSSSGYGSSGAAVGTGSALARILRMQRLHHIGDDVVAWIAANLRLPESLIYADLREARPSSPSNACQTEVITCVDETECKRKKLPNDPMICNELVDEDINDEYIKIMGNYSLFCTARDCSILMTFQEIDKESSETVNAENIIKLSNGQIFLTAVRVLDLDMKSPIIIEKHLQRDIAVLRAIINELKEK